MVPEAYPVAVAEALERKTIAVVFEGTEGEVRIVRQEK